MTIQERVVGSVVILDLSGKLLKQSGVFLRLQQFQRADRKFRFLDEFFQLLADRR